MTTGVPKGGALPTLTPQEAEALAAQHGLELVGQRPSFGAYLRDVWRHRHLMIAMAKGDFVAKHQDNYLGLLWSVINPILLGVSYFLIFGLLIGTRAGIDNFISFLTIGLFTFIPIAAAMTSGGKSVLGKTGMIRSLKFPRVLLPITVMLSEFLAALPAFIILLLIALVSKETPSAKWLLFPVALFIVLVTGMGIAMLCARLVHVARDANNLIPLLVRLLRYVSGVFFSIEDKLGAHDNVPVWLSVSLEYQPVAVLIKLVRETIRQESPLDQATWLVAAGWAVFFLVSGFVVFWRGEGTYGRG